MDRFLIKQNGNNYSGTSKNYYNVVESHEDKKTRILSLKKWCREYRNEYSRLYHKIYVKKQYKKEDLEIFDLMGKKHPQKKNCYHKKEIPECIVEQGLCIENKPVKICFD